MIGKKRTLILLTVGIAFLGILLFYILTNLLNFSNFGWFEHPDNTISNTNEADEKTLTLSIAGTGSGTVTSNPAGVDCSDTCSSMYENSTNITLIANPDDGSVFEGWAGTCSGNDSTCLISTGTPSNVTAVFNASDTEVITLVAKFYCYTFEAEPELDCTERKNEVDVLLYTGVSG